MARASRAAPAGRVPVLATDRPELTVGDLCAWVAFRAYAEKVKRSAVDDRRMIDRYFLPRFGRVRVAEFDAAQAAALIRQPIDAGAKLRTAVKLRALGSVIWNVAAKGSSKIDLGPRRSCPPRPSTPSRCSALRRRRWISTCRRWPSFAPTSTPSIRGDPRDLVAVQPSPA